jgi:hypothetical protein
MKFDYILLMDRIIERYGDIDTFCKLVPMTEKTFNSRIEGKSYFRQCEMKAIAKLLKPTEVTEYFFVPVQ